MHCRARGASLGCGPCRAVRASHRAARGGYGASPARTRRRCPPEAPAWPNGSANLHNALRAGSRWSRDREHENCDRGWMRRHLGYRGPARPMRNGCANREHADARRGGREAVQASFGPPGACDPDPPADCAGPAAGAPPRLRGRSGAGSGGRVEGLDRAARRAQAVLLSGARCGERGCGQATGWSAGLRTRSTPSPDGTGGVTLAPRHAVFRRSYGDLQGKESDVAGRDQAAVTFFG